MRVRNLDELPHKVTVLPQVWIPMSDGARLSARIWLPVDADSRHRVPAILEYHPYRKNERNAEADEEQHHYISALATPASGSTCADPATPRAGCSPTSTHRRNSTTESR